MTDMPELEVQWGRRAFPVSQALMLGTPVSRVQGLIETGWYDTSVHPEEGAFCLVDRAGPLADLLGDIVKITLKDRFIFVYCIGTSSLPFPIALARRAYLSLALLNTEFIKPLVEVVN